MGMASHFLILSLLISFTFATAQETGFVGSLDRRSLGLAQKDMFSHILCYFHEQFTGSNATTVMVVPPLPKYNATSNFGGMGVTDNALTVGPDPASKVVGRIEGMFAATSQTEFNLVQVVNFALTEGKYNGSSIAVLGLNRLSQKVRELPVVGGTGLFKMATGYVETTTLYLDSNRSTIEYNIYVSHY